MPRPFRSRSAQQPTIETRIYPRETVTKFRPGDELFEPIFSFLFLYTLFFKTDERFRYRFRGIASGGRVNEDVALVSSTSGGGFNYYFFSPPRPIARGPRESRGGQLRRRNRQDAHDREQRSDAFPTKLRTS